MLELGGFDRGSVGYCFTDRAGGRSATPYDTLNLSVDVGDEAADVAANRALVLERVGLADAVWLRAEHGAEVGVVDAPDVAARADGDRCDALVTARAGVGLGALAADCALIVLADPAAGVIAVAHCGRPGLVAGVVAAVVRAVRELGGDQVSAAIGPTVCADCYPLPAAMVEEVLDAVPAARAQPGHVDIRAGVVAQLQAADVAVQRLVGGCTREDPNTFSYRRDRMTGRHAALIWRTS